MNLRPPGYERFQHLFSQIHPYLSYDIKCHQIHHKTAFILRFYQKSPAQQHDRKICPHVGKTLEKSATEIENNKINDEIYVP